MKSKEKRVTGVLTRFRELFDDTESISRKELVYFIEMEFGQKAGWAANNYIAQAKRTDKILGFKLAEKEGILTKVKKK